MIKTIQTDSFTMDYCEFGQGDRAFVILPGLSVKSVLLSAEDLERAFAQIAEHFRVYVFDRRKDMPPVYTVYDMARDTALAMEKLGLYDADIFGASQGGMMAMVIAIEHPHLVHRLVLGSTSPRVGEEPVQVVSEWIRLARAGDKTGLFLNFGEKLYAPETFARFRDGLAVVAGTVTEEELSRFVIQAEGSRDFDVTDRLAEIRCPVLVIGDETDAVLGAQATRDIAARLDAQLMQDEPGRTEPAAEDSDASKPDTVDSEASSRNAYYIYDGYGHAAYDTAPDYRERVLRFLLQ